MGAAALPGLPRVDRLVALVGHARVVHVGRQRHAPGRLERALELGAGERRAHEPASLPERLDRLDREASGLGLHAHAGAHAARGAHERLPEAVAALLEQQHLARPAARPAHGHAGAQHAAAVDDDEIGRVEQVDELGEAPVLDRPVAAVHEQPRAVPVLGGPLRDQLAGQRVVELVDAHAPQSRRRPGSPGERDRVIGAATDEVLVRKAAAGGREEFDELVRRHRTRVYALALRICRNPDDAEDALQETFIAAYRALPRFDRRARVSTWLYRIATNKCYDVVARRRPTADAGALPEPADPHDPFARSERSTLLTRALDALPEQFREAALLCDVCGLTPAEAGEVIGVPEGTMKSRSFRARGAARDGAARGRRGTGCGKRGLTDVDDAGNAEELPAEELAAVARALAALGAEPLPGGVAERLDARLAAELSSSPLAARRSRRRRFQIGTGARIGGRRGGA